MRTLSQFGDDLLAVLPRSGCLLATIPIVDQGEGLSAPSHHLWIVFVVEVVAPVDGEPAMGFLSVGGNTLTCLVHEADLELRDLVALGGGGSIPLHRRAVIERHAIAVVVDDGQIVGRIGVPPVRPRLPQPDGLRRLAALVQPGSQAQVVVDAPCTRCQAAGGKGERKAEAR
ncbi:MAG: hypothetical protein V5B34_10285 [Accumulibacter sp.]